MKANAKAERLAFALRFREEKVATDVDDALSALRNARDRIKAAAKSLRLAQTLLRGEKLRLDLGATSVLFVNLRERNAVEAEALLIRARADYEKAWAFYRWATGSWATDPIGRNGGSGTLQAGGVRRHNVP